MKNQMTLKSHVRLLTAFVFLTACVAPGKETSENKVADDLGLKRGDIIVCGPSDKEFGQVQFQTSCSDAVKNDFDFAVSLLHSFEYDEAEKAFARVIDADPGCAMGYWGVAMSNYHPLWDTPSQTDLEKGSKVISRALSLENRTVLEQEFIEAIAEFYRDWAHVDHRTRSVNYSNAMGRLYAQYPKSKEVAIFYSLALIATADPSDKKYENQKRAGAILAGLYPETADHPGIVHYLIHAYDYPELAAQALPAARKYASIAPSSAHAQHMPSHIFTRLGLWDECVEANLASTSSARCYAETAGINGHWDEELHGLDYLVYGYLQKGETALAKEQFDYLKTIKDVSPLNFKVAYAFAAIPSRYHLENKLWSDAANLEIHQTNFPWHKFPWQKSIVHFTRLLGAVHIGKVESATSELDSLQKLHDVLVSQKDAYKAEQVMVQITAGEAWISYRKGNEREAIQLMTLAAEREERMEKHPVTPGPVIPARELLGDLFMELGQPKEALIAYELDLKNHVNRFNGVYGAAQSCEQLNDRANAKKYYQQLLSFSNTSKAGRPEVQKARTFLQN